jgi:hypothetical protein
MLIEMLKKILTIVFLFSVKLLHAQQATGELPLIKSIRGPFSDFSVDVLGNIFLLDKEGRLKKINPAGDSVAVFNDVRRFGKLHSIDASNPLKVLLFYKDFGTIVTLDRLLQMRNTIDLRRLNFLQVKVIGQSFDNGIWIYDEQEARLKRIKDNGSISDQTGDFRLQIDEAPIPTYISDAGRFVYLYDSTKGVLVFDYYGTLKNKLLFTGWDDFQVIDNNIIGRKGITLERYQLNTLQLKELALPSILKEVTKIRIAGNRLYCLRQGNLYIYAL